MGVWEFVAIGELLSHERVRKKRVREVEALVLESGNFKEPIIVERKTRVILDGHHRRAVLEKLGAKRIPAVLVDYSEVRLLKRRKGVAVSKERVVKRARQGNPYPPKTTKHLVPGRVKGLKIPLEELF